MALEQEQISERLLVVAPTPRDAALTEELLAEANVYCRLCSGVADVCRLLGEGAGAVLMTEQSIDADAIELLQAWVGSQPPWSDLPIIVLTRGGREASAARALETLGNVMLLDRPVRLTTLVSAIRTALRARRRQYQIRQHLSDRENSERQLKLLAESLEERVAERTLVAEQRTQQLRALASELTQAEQRERRRLAQLLHDHLQQLLVAAGMKTGLAKRRATDDAPLRDTLQQIEKLLSEAVKASRSLTTELSPPVLYDAGLGPAIEWLARQMQSTHGLPVQVDAPEDLDLRSDDLKVLLFQAVRELLFNVVKHARADQTHVRLWSEGDDVCIEVADNGPGFDPKAAEHKAATGDHFGLFSIRERLELLSGSMKVDAAPGRGTRITLRVSRNAMPGEPGDAMPVDVPTDRKHRREPADIKHRDRIRVLLADDHKIFREGLAGLLSEHDDIELISEAADGQAAVELAQKLHPDVVILDVTMPRMTGVEAARRIAATLPQTRIIGLSMHEETDMAAAMFDAGACAYLTKGGPSDALIAAIRGRSAVTAVDESAALNR